MEPLLLELHAWQPAVFGADDGGQTRKINDRLRRALGADAVTTLNGVERGIADDEWLTAARDQSELLHDGSKTLSNAVAHLVLTRTGDTHRFSRSSSSGPIAAVIASSVGLYLYDHRPAPEWTPATRY
jgi:hypothetical protein